MRRLLSVWILALLCACADFGGFGFEARDEVIGGVVLDGDQPTRRYAIRACYLGSSDPDVVLEFSPWIEFGEGEVAAVWESEPGSEPAYVLTDKRSPVAPLIVERSGAEMCTEGVVVAVVLAKPGAGKTATVAWVAEARAYVDEEPDEAAFMLFVDPV